MSTTDERRRRSGGIRAYTAAYYDTLVQPSHPDNGDEEDFEHENYFASFTKNLPHTDPLGEVVSADYHTMLHALHTGDPSDFNAIPQGCTGAGKKPRRFTNPQSGLAFDLEGIDSHLLTLPPPFKFAAKGSIGEIAENYWLALCREVPFSNYATDSTVAAAVKDLNTYAVFQGPKMGGKVTVQTLFRGRAPGDLLGPYVSQFLLLDLPYGAERFEQKIAFALPEGKEYMIDPNDWLDVQRGCDPGINPAYVDNPKYMYRGRDLAQYVHIDELFQGYLNACLLLITPNARGGLQAPLDLGIPYSSVALNPYKNQDGFGTLGEPNFKVLVAEVATRALKAVWFQKWFVHRRARPETYAGRIHHHLVHTPGAAKYPFEATEFSKLQATVLPKILAHNHTLVPSVTSYMLPMSFPEGSPIHPAYGAGHATVAGACVTLLKAIFKDDEPIKPLIEKAQRKPVGGTTKNWTLVEPNSSGTTLDTYTGAGAGKMTVGSELDKLAGNIGIARNFAGVHWRSDYAESLLLGERLAIHFLRETILTYNEDVTFTFTGFDGVTKHTISKGGVS